MIARSARVNVFPKRARRLRHVQITVFDLPQKAIVFLFTGEEIQAQNIPDKGIGGIQPLCLQVLPIRAEHDIIQRGIPLFGRYPEIEGIILNLHGHMSILNMPITPETVRYALKDRESEKRGITFDDIIKHIAIEYNIKPSEIRTKVRGKKHIAKARKIVAYIARNETTMTLPNIAAELNLKDHSAVSKQIKSITEEIKKDSQLNNQIQNTISKLKQNT